MVLAGSCGGQLPTGRYIDYLGNAAPAYGSGMAHNKLYVTFLKLFGIDENMFGIPDFVGADPGARARGSLSAPVARAVGIAFAAAAFAGPWPCPAARRARR